MFLVASGAKGRTKQLLLATCLAFSAPVLLASISAAQTADAPAAADSEAKVEKVVVTATRREQALQDVPIAVNVISGARIQDTGSTDVSDIVDLLPGVELRTSGSGQGAVAIRGISELNTFNIYGATGTAVGLYIDETPFSIGGFFPESTLFDVKRVEVLRGPQGTLFGEGSLAGTIRIISNEPDAQALDAFASASVGQIEDGGTNTSYNGMVNLPIVKDELAIRLTGFNQENGGWINAVDPIVTASFLPPPNPVLGPAVPNVLTTFNPGPVKEDANDSRSWGGRAQVQWTPSDTFTATASIITQGADRGYRNRGTEARVGTWSTNQEHMDDKFHVYSLVLEQDISFGSILSSTNSFGRTLQQTTDQIGIVPLANQIAYPLSGGAFVFQGSRAIIDVDVSEFNQELRFVSDFGGPFELTGGLFYRDRDIETRIRAPQEPLTPGAIANVLCGGCYGPTPPAGAGDLDSRSISNSKQTAVFAEGTYELNDKLTFLLGARYFIDERESLTRATSLFSGIPFPTNFPSAAEETVFNPRTSLTYKIRDDLTSYVSVGRGFRSGGQNDLYALVGGTPADIAYDSETLTTYEWGLKSYKRDYSFNVSVFYNAWDDLQVVTREGTGGVGEIIGNAGSARSYGIDLDGSLRLNDYLSLNAALTLLDTQLENVVASGVLITKADIPGVSSTSASLGATYRRPISDGVDLFLNADMAYRSDSLSSLLRIGQRTERLDGYTTANLRAGIEMPKWSLVLFADNVTDEFIPLTREVSQNASNPSGGDPITGRDVFMQAPPRTIGLTLNWRLNPK